MAEKHQKKKGKASQQVDEKKQKQYQVLNKYDPYLLKNSLNLGIQNILEEKYLTRENHKHIDNKIILGTIITIIVITSHYFPLEFPHNWWLLVGCVTSYAILSSIFSWYEKYVEKNQFYVFQFGIIEEQQMMNKQFSFASDIQMYNDQYEVLFSSCDNQKNFVARKLYVGKYFDINGNLSLENLENVVKEMINEYKKKFI